MLKSPRAGRPDVSRAFHGALDDRYIRFGTSPRALIGPRFACLWPARASLSLGELYRYHTVGGASPGPRSEPMSRQRDRCAPHDRGVGRRRPCRVMGSKSRSRIFRVSRVSDQPITMGTRICIQYRYKFHRRARDSSQMCDNKVHAQAACAPDEDTQSTRQSTERPRPRATVSRARARPRRR